MLFLYFSQFHPYLINENTLFYYFILIYLFNIILQNLINITYFPIMLIYQNQHDLTLKILLFSLIFIPYYKIIILIIL